jgi:hypothetical protein
MTGKLLAMLEVAQILHDTGLNQRSVYLYMSTTEGCREWYGALGECGPVAEYSAANSKRAI